MRESITVMFLGSFLWILQVPATSLYRLLAAEYGNRLNLTFDEMDSVVTQGKELGIYLYMFTGGEPLVRKSDIIKLCEKHNDCAFLSFTNGTLVDEAFCQEMKRVGNLYLAISLEGFEAVNDLRRGDGVYGKVMNAMDLLKKNGLVFGTSICYTSKNTETVTSDEFIQLMVDKAAVMQCISIICQLEMMLQLNCFQHQSREYI